MDKWKTFIAGCKGGLNLDHDTITQSQNPGAANLLTNYEPSKYGGYRRVNGYEKYDTNAVTGSGDVIGVCVFGSTVIACRGDDVYTGTGSGWTSRATRAGAVRYRFVKYNWNGTRKVIMVDEDNQPASWDGTTYTLLNASGAPANPKYVEEFEKHIFYAGHSANKAQVSWTALGDETNYDAANGAGTLVVGDEITGLKKFRGELYVFCRTRIVKITGTGLANFAVVPVTGNIGCIAPDSIQEISGDILFMAPDGIRPLSATERIGDVEIAAISRNVQPRITDILAQTNIASVVIKSKSQYRLFYNSSSTDNAGALGVLAGLVNRTTPDGGDTAKAWEWTELLGFNCFVLDSDYTTGTTELTIFGARDGYVYKLDSSLARNGGTITAIYKTPPIFLDDASIRKILHKVDVYYKIEGSFSVSASVIFDQMNANTLQPGSFTLTEGDGGTVVYDSTGAVYDTAVYGGTDNPIAANNVHGSGFLIQLQFYSVSSTDYCHTIQGYKLQYALGGRR